MTRKKTLVEMAIDAARKQDGVGSDLEARLLFDIRANGLPVPQLQVKVCKSIGRNWLFDASWPEYKVAVEAQGGIWMGKGAHNTGKAIIRDCEKNNEAQLLGWTVLHITQEHIDDGQAVTWITRALYRAGWRSKKATGD